MPRHKVATHLTSRHDGTGEVVVSNKLGALHLPLDLNGGTKISFRDPDVSWAEKCRLQHAEWAIPEKDLIKFLIFMHFGGMYYRYDSDTGTLHICHLSSRVTGIATLALMLLLVWWRSMGA